MRVKGEKFGVGKLGVRVGVFLNLVVWMVLFFGGVSVAQNGEGQAVLPSEIETKCLVELENHGEKRLNEFIVWLEVHFKNKSSTNSLLPTAMVAYEALKNDLQKKIDEYEVKSAVGGNTYEQLTRLQKCRAKMEEKIKLAREMLSLRAQVTSGIKKATVIEQKYQQINAQLKTLNIQFVKMKVNMDSLSQKIPCYLKKNCNQA